MAWWTHILFFNLRPKTEPYHEGGDDQVKEESLFAVFRRVPALIFPKIFSLWGKILREYLYENFISLLYLLLSAFTYFYLGLTVVTFFLEKNVPRSIPYIVDILSEPYLGTLGIYVIVREIERRRGRAILKSWGELFAVIWFLFLLVASFTVYFSEQYHASTIYKNIVTNSLAALIIRIGTLLR